MKYFVLKPKGADLHAQACRAAMRSYASVIEASNPDFAADLRNWIDREEVAAA
jgi:hypothetical protein